MNKIIFDIGLHKTGTSSRQEFYKKYLSNDFNLILHSFNINTNIDNNEKDCIVAVESLSGMSHNPSEKLENRLEIAWKLSKCYPDAKIILCLRDKDSWKRSAFKQWSYSCYAMSWDEYWKKYDNRLLDWDSYIKYLNSLFKEVYICYFEILKNNPKQFYKNLCNFINCDMPNDFENIIKNESKPNYQIKALYLFDSIFKSNKLHTFINYIIREINRS